VQSTPVPTSTPTRAGPWVGVSVERVEDDALLRGEGWFMDDLDPLPHIAEAAVVRSTEAHARIASVDVSAALAVPGVIGVLTGADVAALSEWLAVQRDEEGLVFVPWAEIIVDMKLPQQLDA